VIQVLREGDGETVTTGDTAAVHYTGWLPDGTQFDSSRGRDPIQFQLGAREVIPGWDEGVAGMRVGGRRQLVIPPELAYGEQGAGGVIPPRATLVFDVELLGVN
jgi:FKBP-type peptidyl-prolyl cis-trans isomerase